jgi:hypothetical protein
MSPNFFAISFWFTHRGSSLSAIFEGILIMPQQPEYGGFLNPKIIAHLNQMVLKLCLSFILIRLINTILRDLYPCFSPQKNSQLGHKILKLLFLLIIHLLLLIHFGPNVL